ncbi:unnamed protein product [Schistocephalus solidus]|uniref:ALMS1 n=1 Tax=Schistocephalus solidus TaxID=70667 RepID=A0A183TSE9_SCHSO|nr:unnamed protein product [Schistocephalus solidus]
MTTMNMTENAVAFTALSEWLKPEVCQPLRNPTPAQLQTEMSPSQTEEAKSFTVSSHQEADLMPAESCIKSEPSNLSDFSGPPTSSPSPLFETKSEPPANNDTIDSSKSYSMEDLLRGEQSLGSESACGSLRRQKRKQPAPLQKTSLNPDWETGPSHYHEALETSLPFREEYFSPEKQQTESASVLQREEGNGELKRNHETEEHSDLIAQLSRNTVAALTRAISKRAKYSDTEEPLRGLEEELKVIVQQVLKSGLVSVGTNDCKSDSKSEKRENMEDAASLSSSGLGVVSMHPSLLTSRDEKSSESTTEVAKSQPQPEGFSLSGYIPPPREIMEALGSNMPVGFDQSFSMYYEAACRVIQMQTAPTVSQGFQSYLPTSVTGEQKCLPDLSLKVEAAIPPEGPVLGTSDRRRDRWLPENLENTWHKVEGSKQTPNQKTPDGVQAHSGAGVPMPCDVSFGSCQEEEVLKAESSKVESLMSLQRHPSEVKMPLSHISQPSDSLLASVFGLQHQLFNQPLTSGPRLLRPPTNEVLQSSHLLNLRAPCQPVEEHKIQIPPEHQTEALSLVVTSAGQNRPATSECFRSAGFQKDSMDANSLSSNVFPSNFPASYGFPTLSHDSLMESPLEPYPPIVGDSGLHPGCAGGGLPRKKRTKVTDTRLVSKPARTPLQPSPEFLHDTALSSSLTGSRSSPVSSEAAQLGPVNCMSSTRRQLDTSPFLRLGLPSLPVGKGLREEPSRTQSHLRFESLFMSDILKGLSVTPFPQLQEAFLRERAFGTPPLTVNTGSMFGQEAGSARGGPRHPFMMPGCIPLFESPTMLPPMSYEATVSATGVGQFSAFPITANNATPRTSPLERQAGHQQSLRRSRSIGNKRITNALSLNSTAISANPSVYGGESERTEQPSGVSKREEDGILHTGGLSDIQASTQGHELVPMVSN